MKGKILAIDTSSSATSVGLSLPDKEEVVTIVGKSSGSHAEELHSLIDQLLVKESVSYSELSTVVIGTGPGSFTGLRIGMSYAKGLCLACDIPLIPINSFTGAAYEFAQERALKEGNHVVVVADARRNELFVAGYRVQKSLCDHHLLLEPTFSPQIGTNKELGLKVEGLSDVHFVAIGEVPQPREDDSVNGALERFSQPLAAGLLRANRILSSEPVDIAEVAPAYVRAVAAKTLKERGKSSSVVDTRGGID